MAIYVIVSTTGMLFSQVSQVEQYKKAEKFYFEKKYEISTQILLKILDTTPEHPGANSLLGDIYFYKGQYEKAISYFLRSIEVSPSPSSEYFRLGQCYSRLKKSADAIDAYSKAYSLDEKLKVALFQMGYVYLYQERDKAKTVRYWRQFVDEAPQDPQREKIIFVLTILENPEFVLPSQDSGISIDEALRIGGKAITAESVKTSDKLAPHEKAKEKNQIQDLPPEDDF